MYNKELATSMLIQIEEALLRLEHRTVDIHCVNNFLLSPERVEKLDAFVCSLLRSVKV